jgi:hypothetical protein
MQIGTAHAIALLLCVFTNLTALLAVGNCPVEDVCPKLQSNCIILACGKWGTFLFSSKYKPVLIYSSLRHGIQA